MRSESTKPTTLLLASLVVLIAMGQDQALAVVPAPIKKEYNEQTQQMPEQRLEELVEKLEKLQQQYIDSLKEIEIELHLIKEESKKNHLKNN